MEVRRSGSNLQGDVVPTLMTAPLTGEALQLRSTVLEDGMLRLSLEMNPSKEYRI